MLHTTSQLHCVSSSLSTAAHGSKQSHAAGNKGAEAVAGTVNQGGSSPHAVRSVVGTRAAGQILHCLRSCMFRSMYSFLPEQGLQLTCFQPWPLLASLSNWVPAGHRHSAAQHGKVTEARHGHTTHAVQAQLPVRITHHLTGSNGPDDSCERVVSQSWVGVLSM